MTGSADITVLMGGPDAEHDVSLASGAAVAEALADSQQGPVRSVVIPRAGVDSLESIPGEVFFPVLHGPWGEGGPLQELLEEDGRPFVGCGSAAARLAMDKNRTKELARDLGLRTPAWELLPAGATPTLTPPVVLKPLREGSSIGMEIATTIADRDRILSRREAQAPPVLVESFITGREVTVGIIGGEPLPAVEIIPHSGTYDFQAKYARSDTRYVIAPDLPDGVDATLEEVALTLFRAIDARHLARVDFLIDETGPWLLEINTMPGFTAQSLLPKAAMARGWPLAEVCGRLIHMALDRPGEAAEALY